jgi:hypothetical protein
MFRQEARSFLSTEDKELPPIPLQMLHHPFLTLSRIFGDVHAGRPHDRSPPSFSHTQPCHEIRSKRHQRTNLSDVPAWGSPEYGHFSNFGGIRREGQGWKLDFNGLQKPRTSGESAVRAKRCEPTRKTFFSNSGPFSASVLIEVGAKVACQGRRRHVHVASAFPLSRYSQAVFGWGATRILFDRGDYGEVRSERGRRYFFTNVTTVWPASGHVGLHTVALSG